MPVLYTIPGCPTAWTRVRYNKAQSRFFDGQKQLKLIIGISIRSCHENTPALKGPLHLETNFFFPWAGAPSKMPTWVNKAPDLDNLNKLIIDVCTDVGVWEDYKLV